MSKLTRVLALAAMVAAMHVAGMATVAQAHPADRVTGEGARRPPTERHVGEAWRKRPPATSRPTTMDAAVRQLLRDRSSIPSGTPAQMPAPVPAESSGQSGWLVASLGVLAAAMALIAGLAVLVARRASRQVRTGPAA
jgi:ferric-dicitrate binding protein FerR (iron transport regulator)